jgi:hypothetical protein
MSGMPSRTGMQANIANFVRPITSGAGDCAGRRKTGKTLHEFLK